MYFAGREEQPKKSRVTAGRSLGSGLPPGSGPLGQRYEAQKQTGTASPKSVFAVPWKDN